MGYLDLAHIGYVLPDGRTLLDDVSFRVGEGAKAALVGANGTGKTTLLRIVAGDLKPSSGTVVSDGGLGVMRQFIGSVHDDTTVRQFLLALAPPAMFLDDLLAERLVQPFAIEIDTGSYWLTRLMSRQETPAMQAFAAWLAEEAGSTPPYR